MTVENLQCQNPKASSLKQYFDSKITETSTFHSFICFKKVQTCISRFPREWLSQLHLNLGWGALLLFKKLHLYEMIKDYMSQKNRSILPLQVSEAMIQAILVGSDLQNMRALHSWFVCPHSYHCIVPIPKCWFCTSLPYVQFALLFKLRFCKLIFVFT